MRESYHIIFMEISVVKFLWFFAMHGRVAFQSHIRCLISCFVFLKCFFFKLSLVNLVLVTVVLKLNKNEKCSLFQLMFNF